MGITRWEMGHEGKLWGGASHFIVSGSVLFYEIRIPACHSYIQYLYPLAVDKYLSPLVEQANDSDPEFGTQGPWSVDPWTQGWTHIVNT